MDDIRQQVNLLEQQRLRAVRGVRKFTAVLKYVAARLGQNSKPLEKRVASA